jgi:cobalt-zinc-cadmium efflux system outer membrane protein
MLLKAAVNLMLALARFTAAAPAAAAGPAALAPPAVAGAAGAAGIAPLVASYRSDRTAAPSTGRAPAAAPPAEDPFAGRERLDRDALLRAVVQRNPSLEAARQAWRAAAAHGLAQGALPDPALSLELTPFALGHGFAEGIEVRQALPLAARRRLGVTAAAAAAGGALADYRAAVVELAAAASLLFDDFYMAERMLAIDDEHLRLAEELRRAAADRYAAGLAPQQEPLQAEVEAARLLHHRSELLVERERLAIRIQELVHAPAGRPLPPPPERLPEPPPAAAPPAAAEELAVAASPEVAARRAAADARRAELDLARLAGRPDVEVMGAYDSRWAAAGQRLLAGVAIALPVHTARRAAERAEAEARLAAAESERIAAEDRVRGAVREAVVRLAEAGHAREIYQERLLPASRDQLRAARSSFEVGRGSFQALIEAERSLREAEIGNEQGLVDLYRRQAEYDRALGRLPPGIDAAEGLPR